MCVSVRVFHGDLWGRSPAPSPSSSWICFSWCSLVAVFVQPFNLFRLPRMGRRSRAVIFQVKMGVDFQTDGPRTHGRVKRSRWWFWEVIWILLGIICEVFPSHSPTASSDEVKVPRGTWNDITWHDMTSSRHVISHRASLCYLIQPKSDFIWLFSFLFLFYRFTCFQSLFSLLLLLWLLRR